MTSRPTRVKREAYHHAATEVKELESPRRDWPNPPPPLDAPTCGWGGGGIVAGDGAV